MAVTHAQGGARPSPCRLGRAVWEGAGRLSRRASPGPGSTAPVHVSRSVALGWAERREEGGRAPPRRVLPGSGRAHSQRVCRGPDAVGCADQLEELRSAPPTLAGSCPAWATHCRCLCRGHNAVGRAEQPEGGAGPLPAGSRPARAAHRQWCHGLATRMLPACAEQPEGLEGPLSAGSRPATRKERARSLPAGSRPARAAYHLCVQQPCPCCCLSSEGGGVPSPPAWAPGLA